MEQAQQALRDSEAVSSQRLTELLLLYDTAPVGLGVVDPDLRYVKVNETLANINGKPMIEHAGRTLFDVLPEEVAKKVEALLRHTILSGIPVTQEEAHGMIPHSLIKKPWWLVACHPVVESTENSCGRRRYHSTEAGRTTNRTPQCRLGQTN